MTRVPLPAEIEDFRIKLETQFRQHWKLAGNAGDPPGIAIVLGSKYAKIVRVETYGNSVYGFIDRANGDLLKAASWAKPAKHPRGNILSDDPLSGCTPYGLAYLR